MHVVLCDAIICKFILTPRVVIVHPGKDKCGVQVVDIPQELPAEAQVAKRQLDALHHHPPDGPSTSTSQASLADQPGRLLPFGTYSFLFQEGMQDFIT